MARARRDLAGQSDGGDRGRRGVDRRARQHTRSPDERPTPSNASFTRCRNVSSNCASSDWRRAGLVSAGDDAPARPRAFRPARWHRSRFRCRRSGPPAKRTDTRVVPISCARTAVPHRARRQRRADAGPKRRAAMSRDDVASMASTLSFASASELARSSNVSDAQKLAQSALAPAGAGTMWTALISHIPPGRNRNRTRPSLSVRAVSFSEGFRRLMATTSAPASGRFSYVRRTGRSWPARSAYGFRSATSSSVKPSDRSPCASFGDPDKHQALRAAREHLAGPGAGLVAPGPQRRDRIEPFFLQILIELLGRQLDGARVAAIADDEQARRGRRARSPPDRRRRGRRAACGPPHPRRRTD